MKLQTVKINYRSLFENMLDGIAYCYMIFDNKKNPVDFVYLSVSDNFEKLTGLKDVGGKKATEVVLGIKKSNPELFEIGGRVSLTGVPERFEVYIQPLSRWFLISVYSFRKKYITAIFQNITDRKRVDKKLQYEKIAAQNVYVDLHTEKIKLDEAKAKDDAILESIGEGLIAVDNDRKIILINKLAVDMLGWKMQDLIGKRITDLPLEDEAGGMVPLNKRPTTVALATGEITKVSYFFVKKDKTRFPIAINATPIKLRGKVIGLIEIIRDITREKEIDRAKTEFVSLASHQLRTPLTGIEWLVDLFLKKEKLTAQGREYLNDIRYSVNRSNAFVKLLLTTSRIESGSVGVNPESFELVGFIEKHISEYQRLCEKKNLSLKFIQHPEKFAVVTDFNLLECILQNLVTNAIDYTPAAGKIDVLLENRNNLVVIQVKDTGIGIPKNEQSRVFERFTRASNAVIAKTDGTGLGLYIAQQAAKLLGGKLSFESEVGKGSTFFVEFPGRFS